MKKIKNIFRIGYERARAALADEQGISVIELVLVLVVIIGLVIIFKAQLTNLIMDIFETISSESALI